MSLESENPGHRRILDDPVAIRALAHPLRLKISGLIGRQGPMTAAQAARELDISQALASHHLRQLAKYGFVEPAEGGNKRDRPWRIAHTSMALARRGPDEPTNTAADLLEQIIAERALDDLAEWHQHRDDYDERWREHSGVGQSLIYLTVEEYDELHRGLDALINPLVERRRLGDAAARPPDARPVNLVLISVPVPQTKSGG